jgi:hypothetical protein
MLFSTPRSSGKAERFGYFLSQKLVTRQVPQKLKTALQLVESYWKGLLKPQEFYSRDLEIQVT